MMVVTLLMMPTLFSTQPVLRCLQGGEEREKRGQVEEVQDRHWSLLLGRVLRGHSWQLPFSSYVKTYWDLSAHRY